MFLEKKSLNSWKSTDKNGCEYDTFWIMISIALLWCLVSNVWLSASVMHWNTFHTSIQIIELSGIHLPILVNCLPYTRIKWVLYRFLFSVRFFRCTIKDRISLFGLQWSCQVLFCVWTDELCTHFGCTLWFQWNRHFPSYTIYINVLCWHFKLNTRQIHKNTMNAFLTTVES